MHEIPTSVTFNPPSSKLVLFIMANSPNPSTLYSWHPAEGHTQVLRMGRVGDKFSYEPFKLRIREEPLLL